MGNKVTKCRWRHAPEARGGKVSRAETTRQTRRLTLGARWGETNLRATGAARMGVADEKDSIERLCLSPYVEEPFNSKVIKGSYLNWEFVSNSDNLVIVF